MRARRVATAARASVRMPHARRCACRRGRAVEPALPASQQRAHPGDRMPDRAVDEGRIADRRLQQECGQRQFDVGKMVHGFAGAGSGRGARATVSRRQYQCRAAPVPGCAGALDRSFDRHQPGALSGRRIFAPAPGPGCRSRRTWRLWRPRRGRPMALGSQPGSLPRPGRRR